MSTDHQPRRPHDGAPQDGAPQDRLDPLSATTVDALVSDPAESPVAVAEAQERPRRAAGAAAHQLAMAGASASLGEGKSSLRAVKDRLATGVVWAAFAIAMIPLVWIIVSLILKGAHNATVASWWTNSQRGMTTFIEGGGAYHAILGSLEQALVTSVISVPIGVMTAVYLIEYGRGTRLARVVSFMVDILTGVPSIVAGLFIYALWVTTLGFQRVAFAVCLSLMLLMIPTVTRSTEEMLKLVPNELREASYALGVPKWRTIMKVVLPTAFSGIVTGVLLGLARVMGETAPLLILGPYTQSIATNLFSGYMATLPTMINAERNNVADIPLDRVWASALTLILLILVLNLIGRVVAHFSSVRK